MQLPNKIHNLYLDFETSSGDPKLAATNPFRNCKPIGAAVTWDDNPETYFLTHNECCNGVLQQLLCISEYWINHNVKFDCHVFINNYGKLPSNLRLVDTVVGSKLINSDLMYHGGYSLDNVMKVFLHEDITDYEAKLQPYLYKNKDYANIPINLLSDYARMDVTANRKLHNFIQQTMPEECLEVWETEQQLTKILVEVEQYGMRIDLNQIRATHLAYMYKMIKLEEELSKITGRLHFRPHTNADCEEVICGQYGQPVVEWTDAQKPSFSKYALLVYLNNPEIPAGIIERIIAYRRLATACSLFIEPYQVQHVDGILHCTYNQTVQTGRMSCSDPNLQQINKAAKVLTVPRDGNSFIEFDLSQIEFRVIVSYIKDQKAIEAYQNNADTDFHQFSGDMCNISRQAAKTLNFACGYGAGKGKVLKLLSASKSNKSPEVVYNTYHNTFPTLKSTAREAAGVAYHRGYVYDLYGRRRHIPPNMCYIAFNTVCQATAASLMKDRIVAIHKLIKQNNWPINIVATVHDSLLLESNTVDKEAIEQIKSTLENPTRKLRVPVRSQYGISNKNWAECLQ